MFHFSSRQESYITPEHIWIPLSVLQAHSDTLLMQLVKLSLFVTPPTHTHSFFIYFFSIVTREDDGNTGRTRSCLHVTGPTLARCSCCQSGRGNCSLDSQSSAVSVILGGGVLCKVEVSRL